MRNTTLTAPLAKNSSKVQNRRRKLYQRNFTLISPLKFAKLHNGSLRMKYTQGLYYIGFESADKKTHAWGSSFTAAYLNFLRLFHERYTAA